MLSVCTTDDFERDLVRLKRQGKDLDDLFAVVEILASGEILDEAFNDHALWGEWAGSRECHIEGDWLLAYRITGNELKLERTGTHVDLFRSWLRPEQNGT